MKKYVKNMNNYERVCENVVFQDLGPLLNICEYTFFIPPPLESYVGNKKYEWICENAENLKKYMGNESSI